MEDLFKILFLFTARIDSSIYVFISEGPVVFFFLNRYLQEYKDVLGQFGEEAFLFSIKLSEKQTRNWLSFENNDTQNIGSLLPGV